MRQHELREHIGTVGAAGFEAGTCDTGRSDGNYYEYANPA